MDAIGTYARLEWASENDPDMAEQEPYMLTVPAVHRAASRLHKLQQLVAQTCQVWPQLPQHIHAFQEEKDTHPLNNQREMVRCILYLF